MPLVFSDTTNLIAAFLTVMAENDSTKLLHAQRERLIRVLAMYGNDTPINEQYYDVLYAVLKIEQTLCLKRIADDLHIFRQKV